jgi:hypothetical protein
VWCTCIYAGRAFMQGVHLSGISSNNPRKSKELRKLPILKGPEVLHLEFPNYSEISFVCCQMLSCCHWLIHCHSCLATQARWLDYELHYVPLLQLGFHSAHTRHSISRWDPGGAAGLLSLWLQGRFSPSSMSISACPFVTSFSSPF